MALVPMPVLLVTGPCRCPLAHFFFLLPSFPFFHMPPQLFPLWQLHGSLWLPLADVPSLFGISGTDDLTAAFRHFLYPFFYPPLLPFFPCNKSASSPFLSLPPFETPLPPRVFPHCHLILSSITGVAPSFVSPVVLFLFFFFL